MHRDWRPEVAVMPRAYVSGDDVRIVGVRDFQYRSVDDFTPATSERTVQLSHLVGVDFYISYWMPGPVGHTFLSFTFDDAEPISISIEARPEAHEGFAPVGSLFKQFELIYVVGEERDLVGVRHQLSTRGCISVSNQHHTGEMHASCSSSTWSASTNWSERAEFYHLLSNNCTLNIVRYANAVGPGSRFDIRHYLNGLFDGYLYQRQLLEGSMPFEDLRRQRPDQQGGAGGRLGR